MGSGRRMRLRRSRGRFAKKAAQGAMPFRPRSTISSRPVEHGRGASCARRPCPGAPEDDAWTEADALYLDGVQDAGNAGTLIRTAVAAGVRVVAASPAAATPLVAQGDARPGWARISEPSSLRTCRPKPSAGPTAAASTRPMPEAARIFSALPTRLPRGPSAGSWARKGRASRTLGFPVADPALLHPDRSRVREPQRGGPPPRSASLTRVDGVLRAGARKVALRSAGAAGRVSYRRNSLQKNPCFSCSGAIKRINCALDAAGNAGMSSAFPAFLFLENSRSPAAARSP